MEQTEFGNAYAGKACDLPKIKQVNAEIEATELDEHETRYCLWVGKSIKWRKSQNETPDYKAKPTDGKINIVK